MDRKDWLDFLYYDVGKQWTDYWTTYTYIVQGQVRFTKWKRYLEVQEKPELWQKVNQRTLLINEIVLDYEGSWSEYQKIIKSLQKAHMEFRAYSTAEHRAQHIHLFFGLDFAKLPDHRREEYRRAFIRKYGCDAMLAGRKHMIPLEHFAHWKTGQGKELIANG